MRPEQSFIGEVQARRTHSTGYHLSAITEKILIVAVEGATIGEN